MQRSFLFSYLQAPYFILRNTNKRTAHILLHVSFTETAPVTIMTQHFSAFPCYLIHFDDFFCIGNSLLSFQIKTLPLFQFFISSKNVQLNWNYAHGSSGFSEIAWHKLFELFQALIWQNRFHAICQVNNMDIIDENIFFPPMQYCCYFQCSWSKSFR